MIRRDGPFMSALGNGARLGVRLLGRDWRSGELRLLLLSLVLAVGAITSVAFFTERLHSGLERDAQRLMGADLVLSADAPIDEAIRQAVHQQRLSTAQTITFPSMVQAPDAARLAAVKAVSEGYPLRGSLRVANSPNGIDRVTSERPGPGEVWVDPELLNQLQLAVGASIELGTRTLRITQVLTQEPDRGLSFVNIAPRLLMRIEDLESTGLVTVGSRATYRLLIAGADEDVATERRQLQDRLGRGQRLESIDNVRPEIRAALDRAQQFLALVALLTALLAAVAIAVAARRFSERHLDACAVMRCLGASQNQLLATYLSEFVALGFVGCFLGVLFGLATHFAFVLILGSIIQAELPAPGVLPALQGFLVGFVLVIGFALPPIVQLRQVPPVRVLRRDVGLPSAGTAIGYLCGTILFIVLLLWSARDLKVGLWTAGGFCLAFLVFASCSWLLLRLLGVLRQSTQAVNSIRFAIASLRRRPLAVIVQIVALALGLMALLLLSVTRNDLVAGWRNSVSPDAPNRFVINILPEQRATFTERVRALGIGSFDLAPMVRGRLLRINDRAVSAKAYADDSAKRLVDREFNLSYGTELPAHNRIAAGSWFAVDATGELSMEEGVARSLNVHLNDVLVFSVADQEVSGRVTSLRKLDWDSMHVNFFVIFPPKALESMPQTWITAFHIDQTQASVINELVRAFPNVTVIDMGAVLRQIQGILDQVIAAIEFLFAFTLVAGLLVLYAALLSSRDERTREAALLRALGASRNHLAKVHLIEFALLGLISGLLAAAGAVAIGYCLASYVFHFDYRFSTSTWVIGTFGGVLIALLGGWLGLRPVLNQPPLASLRDA